MLAATATMTAGSDRAKSRTPLLSWGGEAAAGPWDPSVGRLRIAWDELGPTRNRHTGEAAHVDQIAAVRQGLRETGFVEGESVSIEYRSAEGRAERLPELADQVSLSMILDGICPFF
jgi:hypothetical protein